MPRNDRSIPKSKIYTLKTATIFYCKKFAGEHVLELRDLTYVDGFRDDATGAP